MDEELFILMLVAERLEGAGLRYMVSGSAAMNFYAEPRMTRDVDIVVALEQRDASTISRLFSTDFDCDEEEIRSAIQRRSMFNLIHMDRVVKVDFIVRKDSPYRLTEFDRRQRLAVPQGSLWVATREDLILSKLDWSRLSNSELQMRDIQNLLRTDLLDWTYLQHWATELGVLTRLLAAKT